MNELIGMHISSNELACFFPPYTKQLRQLAGGAPKHQLQALHAGKSAYVYLGAIGQQEDIIAYERTNIWMSSGYLSSFADGKVNVLRADLTVRRMEKHELLNRLSRLFHEMELQR